MKKKLFAVLATLALLVVGATLVKAQSDGTTYTQTTHKCLLTQCIDAEFTPTGTLTYGAFFQHCGDQNVKFLASWNGAAYSEGKASMIFIGPEYNGKDYFPWTVWEMRGTFDNGTRTVIEHVVTFRGCAGGQNIDGFVTVQ